MKLTSTFTQAHLTELQRIATLSVFAAKIAQTILSKEYYQASSKQVDILNQVADFGDIFYISNDVAEVIEVRNRERQYNAAFGTGRCPLTGRKF